MTDVRLSSGDYHCHRCGVLAATSTGRVYLYTQESGEQVTFKVQDVTDELEAGDLPSSFSLNSDRVLDFHVETERVVQPVEQVDPDKLVTLPSGNILYSGHCYIGCSEGMFSALDVALVDGDGLWLLGYVSTGGGIIPSLGPVMEYLNISFCFSAILMTAIVIWLGRRMWPDNSRAA